MLGIRVRRVVTAATLFLATVCIPAGPALADLGDPDPGNGTATTTTTLETPPTEPSSSTTTTTTSSDPSTDPSTTTTTSSPDDDSGDTTTSTSPPSTAPTDPSTTSTTLQSSGGRGRSTTTTTRPSSSTPATAPTATTDPALPPAGAAVTNDAAGSAVAGGDAGGASAGTSPSGGSARNTRPSPTRPGKDSETSAETPPDPNWFDASGLSGLLGVSDGAANAAPAGDTSASAPTELASALPSRDHASGSSSAVLLGLSLLILLALAGGAAFRWWDQRPDRYWSA